MSTDRSAAFTSLQMQGVAKVDLRIDADDAAQRLSKAIKFRTVLRPAQLFTMRLSIDEVGSKATFTLSSQARVFSSGRITFAGN